MKTKICYACNLEKPLTEFSFKNKTTKLYAAECKSCHKLYNQQWYQNNKALVKQRTRKSNKLYKENIYAVINKLKSVPCADCKHSFHPIAMDFDHLDSSTKTDCVSHLIRLMKPLDVILTEVKKCEVVCAVCHRIRTYNRQQLKSRGTRI